MRHLREEYNRIQDPENEIGEDEPVFLLRAQDRAFPLMVNAYIFYQRAIGNHETADSLTNQLPEIYDWIKDNAVKDANRSK